MARIAFLVKQPKRALGALAVLVAATGVVVGSGANFSASSASASNSFTAGTLSIVNDKENAAIFTASGKDNLKPGGAWVTGTADIQNTGSLAGVFTLTRDSITNTDAVNPMSAKLNLIVKDCGVWPNASTPEPCGDGDDVTRFGSTTTTIEGGTWPVPLGTFAAGEKHRYEFSVQLDSTATDAYQGDGATVRFVWNATQA